jgi:hypothetical protein
VSVFVAEREPDPATASHRQSKSRFLIAVALATSLTGLSTIWIALQLGGARTTLWVDDCVTPVAAAVACLCCLHARARCEERLRLFWSIMGCATALWTLAEITWGVYPLLLDRTVPSPSWADVGYLSAVVVVVVALLFHPAISGSATRTGRSALDAIAVATALMFLSWTFVLGPLWRSTDLSTAGGIVTLAYPFGDVVIVFFVVLVIRRMTGGYRASLWWLLAALLMLAFSDSVYTYLTEVSNYSSTSPDLVDAGWIAAYLGIGLAALASRVEGDAVRVAAQSRPSLISMVSPLLLVLAALTAAAVRIELGHHLERVSWLLAFGLIAAVLVRQGLLVLELVQSRPGGAAMARRPAVGVIPNGPGGVRSGSSPSP